VFLHCEQVAETDSEAEEAYDDEKIANNALLAPLREALMRARQKRDEAADLREAREAKVYIYSLLIPSCFQFS
jgi:hypothetical protein